MPYMPALLTHTVGTITTGGAGTSVDSLNDILTGCGVAIGVILILAAVIKLIMAGASESAADHQKGSLMLGVGILFVSVNAVLSTLGVSSISSASDGNTVAANVIDVICTMAGYAGAILIVVGIIRYVVAIAQESSDGMTKATMDVTVAVGLIAVHTLGSLLGGFILAGEDSADTYVDAVAGWIATLMTYAGGLCLLISVFKLVNSVRTEDTRERDSAFRLALVAIALLSIRAILHLVGFGAGIDTYSAF